MRRVFAIILCLILSFSMVGDVIALGTNEIPNTFIVSGRVIAEDGSPINSVEVEFIKGSVVGKTTTNEEGFFSLEVEEGVYEIAFNALGKWNLIINSIDVSTEVVLGDITLIEQVSNPTFKRGEQVNFYLFADAENLEMNGTLPEGISFSPNGLLSGSPKVAGVFPVTITRAVGDSTMAASFDITVVKSDNANLSGIVINGKPIEGFSSNKLSYNYLKKVGETLNQSSVVVTKANEFANVQTSVTASKIDIVVTADNGSKKTYTVNIENEKIPVEKVTVPSKNIKLLVDGTAELVYEVSPKNTTDVVIWSVVDSSIVSLKDGVITGHKAGKTTIQAKDQTGKLLQEIVIDVYPVGDVNLDGRVDINDAIQILRYVVGQAKLTGFNLTAGDVNFDGNVNINDAILVLRHIVGDANLGKGPLSGKVVMLDPGHGGRDPGAVAHGYHERLLNDQLSDAIAKELRAAGATVLFTRQPFNNITIEMADRIPTINKSNADIFISVHHDGSTNQSVRGASVFYSTYRPAVTTKDVYVLWNGKKYPYVGEIDTSKGNEGGYIINDNGTLRSLTFSTGARAYSSNPSQVAKNSIVLADKVYQALIKSGLRERSAPYDTNYYMTRWPNIPAILLEAGFVTNKEDVTLAANPVEQAKRARLITEAIIEYFKVVDKK
ncbi:N-acetylmuramoyl-L-alanine amidase [Alkalicella caledoniensis]|uniref:N-acetylmuramoyl-L-alanine amidase n=1 Tax=Alkalicella caledoniensis TaxID=2731377 RepID=A0A7G9WCX9_ALKCA|nr:N-acetylmuramoyl-L-alanine amidase [Alkalicella caledoniensis]QNO16541.1 N-acetylmuramoyl-L-alanine amidase [Alkalicella caledoniensis]